MNGSNFLFVLQIDNRQPNGLLVNRPRAMRTNTPEDRCEKYNEWCAINCQSEARVVLWGTRTPLLPGYSVSDIMPCEECYYHASFEDVTDAQLFRMTFPEVRG